MYEAYKSANVLICGYFLVCAVMFNEVYGVYAERCSSHLLIFCISIRILKLQAKYQRTLLNFSATMKDLWQSRLKPE